MPRRSNAFRRAVQRRVSRRPHQYATVLQTNLEPRSALVFAPTGPMAQVQRVGQTQNAGGPAPGIWDSIANGMSCRRWVLRTGSRHTCPYVRPEPEYGNATQLEMPSAPDS